MRNQKPSMRHFGKYDESNEQPDGISKKFKQNRAWIKVTHHGKNAKQERGRNNNRIQ